MFQFLKRKTGGANRLEADVSKLKAGKMTMQEFIDAHAEIPLYYSTPAGEDQNGTMRLWVLSTRDSQTSYYPAFRSEEGCRRFFTASGREAFLIIAGTLRGALDSLDVAPPLQTLGLVIDPDSASPLEIAPGLRPKK